MYLRVDFIHRVDFEEVSGHRVLITFPDKNGSLYLNCTKNVGSAAEYLLSFWESGILVDVK